MKPATTPTIDPKRVRDLLTLAGELTSLHGQLAEQLTEKLVAIKKADVELMVSIDERQAVVIRRINEREGLRKQWLENVAPTIGLSPKAARSLKASQVLSFVNNDQRQSLQKAFDALRGSVALVREKNEQVARISRGVLGHLAWVLSSVTQRPATEITYSPKGINPPNAGAMLLEAIG